MRKREGAHDTSNPELIKTYFVEWPLLINSQPPRDPFTTYNSYFCHNLLARAILPMMSGRISMSNVKFSYTKPGGDRRHYVIEEDVRIVLSRLPEEVYSRLRVVHFNDRSWGVRTLGYTTKRGRKDVAICALPPRVSLTRFLVTGQRPETFGAQRGQQWPELAVRRFLLYDVLLHEIGHLQIINPESNNFRRKYAHETKTQQFADSWRKKLWNQYFEHPDPVHNAPTADELT
jgi:hypothetical protein